MFSYQWVIRCGLVDWSGRESISPVSRFHRLLCVLCVKRNRYALLLFLLFWLQGPIEGVAEVTTSVTSGLALDTLEWTIGPSTSFPISRLVFESTSWQNSLDVQWEDETRPWFIRGSAGMGWILSGQVVDRDFALPNQQGLFSESVSDINGHNSLVFSVETGYRVLRTDRIGVALTTGFTWTQIRFQIQDGVQTVPPAGADLSGLNSEYRARWYGPMVGIRWTTDLKPVPLLLSVEGHYWPVVWYRGKGTWNLRDDFEQTPSFIHEDQNGHGGDVSTTLQYSITKSWMMTAGWTGRFLRTSNGMDRTFFSDGTQGSIPLLRVSQDTHWFHIGLGYVW